MSQASTAKSTQQARSSLHALNQAWRFITAPLRLCAALLLVLLGISTQLSLFWWIRPTSIGRIVMCWSRTMLLCLGVRSVRIDHPKHLPALFVSNHVSWLDILAIQALVPVVFVAKSDIKSWPVIGWMVTLAGTCFIYRERRTALRGVHTTLAAHLRTGQNVCVFPEGTTSDGSHVLPFHAGLLQAAIAANVPIQPVRLDYSHEAAAYIGNLSLMGSLARILCTPALTVTSCVLPVISVQTQSRQQLAMLAHNCISNASTHQIAIKV
jgi:1-acyl-sn-glycerol-3-phosphate acyltransferase